MRSRSLADALLQSQGQIGRGSVLTCAYFVFPAGFQKIETRQIEAFFTASESFRCANFQA
jgi:hypothetical protein